MLTYRLPEVLRTFRKQYPKVELIFEPYLHEGLLRSIESGKLDLVVCMTDALAEERLKSLRLRTEKLLFIVGPKDPLGSRKRVEPRDLDGQTLLVTEVGCAYRKKLDQLLSRMNIRPTNIIEFSSVEAIKECVSLDMGLALLPEVAVAERLTGRRISAVRWAGPEMDIATHVVWHKDKWISPAAAAFLALLQDVLCLPPSRLSRLRP